MLVLRFNTLHCAFTSGNFYKGTLDHELQTVLDKMISFRILLGYGSCF